MRALIGGRWAISVQGWLVSVVFVVVVAVSFRTEHGPLRNLGPMLLALLAVALLLFVANATLFRNRRQHPVPIGWVVALGAVLWPVTLPFRWMAGYAMVGAPAGTASAASAVAVAALLAVQGAVAWPSISLALASHDSYRQRRAKLIDQAVRQESARLRDIGAITALKAAAMEDLGRDIGPSMERAAAAAAGAGDPTTDLPALADLLSETASGVVRPRSHDLWRSASAGMPRVRPRMVLRSAFAREPLPLAVTLLAFSITFLIGGLARLGWVWLPATAACLACITVIYVAGRRAIHAWPRHTASIGIVTIVITTVSVGCMSLLLFDSEAERVATLTGAVFLGCALASSAAMTAFRTGEDVIDELTDLVDQRAVEQAALRREVVALDRELASHLHGTVQARLVAAAYALREADRTGDRDAARLAADAAQMALADAVATPVPPLPPGTPTDLRADVTAQWGDVLALTWSQAPGPLSNDEARSAAHVLGHALKNAIVHGGATAVDIAVVRASGVIRMTVTDDGLGPAGGAPGMGSAQLDEVADAWSLDAATPRGAVLHVRLAPPAQAPPAP